MSLSKVQWYAHRLRSMGPAEIAQRLGHFVSQRTESAGLRKLGSQEACDWSRPTSFPALPSKEAFSAGALAGLTDEVKSIREGTWTMMHGHTFEVGEMPSWQKDYLDGSDHFDMRAARLLNHRELPGKADIRVIWEVNRWSQIVRLAQGAWLLEDRESGLRAVDLLENWISTNPPGVGWNWTNPMEPAIRLINLVWIDVLLEASETWAVDPGRRGRLLQEIVPSHFWWVSRYQSVGSSANNHLLVELTGLLMAHARWSECSKWGSGSESLAEIMTAQILDQFDEDGGNREQALHYHLFALESCWQAVRAIRAMGLQANGQVENRLGDACRFFSEVVHTDEPWDFGDSDDAHLTPVFSRTSSLLGDWKAWCSGEESIVSFWLGDRPQPSVERKSLALGGAWSYFPKSGIATSSPDDRWKARLDASPLGFGRMAAHGHLDALHLSLWYGGSAVIVDPGTGGYYASPRERAYFPSWEAHNGPHLHGDSTPKRLGPFLWSEKHECPTVSAEGQSVVAQLLRPGGKLNRMVEFHEGAWIVSDSCQSSDSHAVFNVNWQFAPVYKLERSEDRCFRFLREDTGLRVEIEIQEADSVRLVTAQQQSESEPLALGACSPCFQKIVFGNAVACSGVAAAKVGVRTTLRILEN